MLKGFGTPRRACAAGIWGKRPGDAENSDVDGIAGMQWVPCLVWLDARHQYAAWALGQGSISHPLARLAFVHASAPIARR